MIKKINLVNFKSFDKAEIEFDDNNAIYLFVADNEKGKSSILEAIFSLVTGKVAKDYLKKGTEKGAVDGDFEIDGVGIVNIRITMNKSGSNSLTITYPDNSKSHIKGDLRDLFKDYIEIEPNEWLNAGKTAEGKRWQLSIVKKLLPQSVLNEIDTIDNTIEKKQKISEDIWNDKLVREKILKEMTIIDEETKQQRQIIPDVDYAKYDKKFDSKDITESLQEKTKTLAILNSARQFIERYDLFEMNREVAVIDDEIINVDVELEKEIKRLKEIAENKKASLKEKKVNLQNKIKQNKERHEKAQAYIKSVDRDKIEKEIESLQARMNDIENYNFNYNTIVSHWQKAKEFDDLKRKHKEKRAEIHELVDKREELIKSANLPSDKITFSKDELLFITEEGETVPYHIGVSEARNLEIVLKLNAALNPDTPIFRIDKAGNIGKIWHSIEQYAKDFEKRTGKKMHIFAEKVLLGQEKIVMEVFENGRFKEYNKQPKIEKRTINKDVETKEKENDKLKEKENSEMKEKEIFESIGSEDFEINKNNSLEKEDDDTKSKDNNKLNDMLGEIDFNSFD